MALVKGEDKVLYIQDSSADRILPLACLTSNVFSESAEFFDTTTRDNAGWKTSKPISQSYGVSFSAVTDYADTSSKALLNEIQLLKRAKTLIVWAILDFENNIVDYGRGYIGDISESAPVDGYATFDGEIIGYGKAEKGIPTPTISTITSNFIGVGNYGVTVNFTSSDNPVNIWGRLYTALPTTSGVLVYHDGVLETTGAPVQATISDGFAFYTTSDNGTSDITIRFQLDTGWIGTLSNAVSHNVS